MRRLAGVAGEGPGASSQRKQIISDVSALRRAGEINSYVDLLFFAMMVLLCVSKIVTNWIVASDASFSDLDQMLQRASTGICGVRVCAAGRLARASRMRLAVDRPA